MVSSTGNTPTAAASLAKGHQSNNRAGVKPAVTVLAGAMGVWWVEGLQTDPPHLPARSGQEPGESVLVEGEKHGHV